jgi:hypothetical protein
MGEISAGVGVESLVLDHAAEFVERVMARAPARYEALRVEPRVDRLLAGENAFNPGQLYAYAEYLVFREEFTRRFPDARPRACVNAFCRLFLKNDVSMSNLVRLFEGGVEAELARMERLDP